LLHVVANLIYIFLVSCQLIVLKSLPKLLHSLMVKKSVPGCSEKFHLGWCQSFYLPPPKGPNFAPMLKNWDK